MGNEKPDVPSANSVETAPRPLSRSSRGNELDEVWGVSEVNVVYCII